MFSCRTKLEKFECLKNRGSNSFPKRSWFGTMISASDSRLKNALTEERVARVGPVNQFISTSVRHHTAMSSYSSPRTNPQDLPVELLQKRRNFDHLAILIHAQSRFMYPRTPRPSRRCRRAMERMQQVLVVGDSRGRAVRIYHRRWCELRWAGDSIQIGSHVASSTIGGRGTG